ncbi:MAG: hypothetical protein ABR953_12800 [Candidatus Acidiferrales bacterium]
MHQTSAIFTKTRILIGVFAVFALAAMLCAGRAAAQAQAGPQAGATPSDQPVAQAGAQTPAQIGGHPSLAGAWTLNKDQSDDARAKMREAMGNSGGQGGGGGRGGMGGGGQRGGGGMGGGRGQGAGGEMNEFSQLTIEQTATSAKVAGSSGRALAVYLNSDASKSNSSNSGNSEDENAPAVAQWKGDQLVAVTQGRRGGSTTRTYELSPDGKQLYVTTKMDNPRFQQPVTFRFVYDPAQTSK